MTIKSNQIVGWSKLTILASVFVPNLLCASSEPSAATGSPFLFEYFPANLEALKMDSQDSYETLKQESCEGKISYLNALQDPTLVRHAVTKILETFRPGSQGSDGQKRNYIAILRESIGILGNTLLTLHMEKDQATSQLSMQGRQAEDRKFSRTELDEVLTRLSRKQEFCLTARENLERELFRMLSSTQNPTVTAHPVG